MHLAPYIIARFWLCSRKKTKKQNSSNKRNRGSFLLMAAVFIFLLLLFSFSITTAQQRHSNISKTSSLTPTTDSLWFSPSGFFAFGFYHAEGGFAIGIILVGNPQNTIVWTANRDEPPVSSNVSLVFTVHGLVLRTSQGREISIIDPHQNASSASMLDSGNFVLYNSKQEIIWQSFDHPTDTLLSGQRLQAGAELVSSVSEKNYSTGMFQLKMQHDGNLVQYPTNVPEVVEYAYWASDTHGEGDNATLNLDADGYLYLLNATGFNIKNLTDGGGPQEETIYLMKIDVDGIFRLYSRGLDQSSEWSVEWSSSIDKCDPKGLCGLNSYCSLMDQEPVCTCLPGFDFVDKSQKSWGCERNFVAEACKNNDGSIEYSIESLQSVMWEDDSYLVISSRTEENCIEACLEDCNCEAALFKNSECRKQKLPSRFGRRSLSDETTAFVKVGTSTATRRAPKESKKEWRKDILIISCSLLALACIVLAISGLLIYRNRGCTLKKVSKQGNLRLTEGATLQSFTYQELKKVTNGFTEVLGKGGFGTVYKGAMSNGQRLVAVKKLNVSTGEKEFRTEMKALAGTHHRNLVQLLGYCLEGPNRFLVYEYISNGSLANLLFTPAKWPRWDERMGIAQNVARGILYLHEECETQIMHCDIKPQNILMDEYGGAKISSFGLAKRLKHGQTSTLAEIRGTKGYIAPEWFRNQPVTVKVDVYSFGIMLLQTICCRKNFDLSLPDEEIGLNEWVSHCFEAGELGKLVDDEEVDKRELERMVKVGLWCIQDEPRLRPSIKKVLLMLEGSIIDIPVPPSTSTTYFSAV